MSATKDIEFVDSLCAILATTVCDSKSFAMLNQHLGFVRRIVKMFDFCAGDFQGDDIGHADRALENIFTILDRFIFADSQSDPHVLATLKELVMHLESYHLIN
jgi:hypothetical protein